MTKEARIIKDFGPHPWEISPYVNQRGYEAWKACVTRWTRDEVIAEILAAIRERRA